RHGADGIGSERRERRRRENRRRRPVAYPRPVPSGANELTPRDILGSFVAAGGPAVSPDGERVVYAVRRVDLDANRYRSQLWIAPTDASALPRPLTDGAKGDSDPVWSPD